ncbi:MAG: integrase core domain-containing protein [Candidatus Dormibacteraceae bacterium]
MLEVRFVEGFDLKLCSTTYTFQRLRPAGLGNGLPTSDPCLGDWLLILNRRHLERVLTDWVEHYNKARPHRGLDLQTPIARSDPVVTSGPVMCEERLCGLLREYSARRCRPRRESGLASNGCQ